MVRAISGIKLQNEGNIHSIPFRLGLVCLVLAFGMSYVQLHFEELGDPFEVLKLVTIQGIPSASGEHDVVVKVTATPVHPVYFALISGRFPGAKAPGIPGFEGAGVVVSVGSAVTKYKAGQRVIFGSPGTFSEYTVIPEDKIIPVDIPDNITDAEAAQWQINPITVYGLLLVTAKIEKDDWVISAAAGSTLGRLLIQVAKFKNINVINLVRRPEQVKQLKDETGAEHVLQYESGDFTDVLAQVHHITGGKGVKYAYDPVSGATSEFLYKTLRPDGELIQYGFLSGTPPEAVKDKSNVRLFQMSSLFPLPNYQEIRNTVLDWIFTKKIVIPVEKVYGFHDWVAALKHSVAPGNRGKVLLGVV